MALERLDPQQCRDTYVLDHYGRYCFAAPYVAGKRVLDVACGYGYGSHLLREAGAASVVGVDISQDAIDYARGRYAAPGIEYVVGDASKLAEVVSGVFDVVVSFETLEHIREPDRFIQSLPALVHDESILFFSVPNEGGQPIDNPFHLHKFDQEQFEALLRKAFSIGAILPIYISVSAVVGEPGAERIGPLSVTRGPIVQVESDVPKPSAFLAVCGTRPSQVGPRTLIIHSWSVAENDKNYRLWLEDQRNSWTNRAHDLEKHKEEADRRCAALEELVDEQADHIEELEQARGWADARRKAWAEKFAALKSRVRALDQERDKLERERQAWLKTLAELPRNTHALREKVRHLEQDLAGKNADCGHLCDELHACYVHLANIEASLGWRLTRRVRERVLPPDKVRGRVARRLLRGILGNGTGEGS